MLTRIRNASLAKKSLVNIPFTNLNQEIANLLEKEGFADEDEPYDSIGGHSVNDLKKAFAKTKSKDEELGEGWDDFTQKRRYPEDYKAEKYRKLPKDVFRSGNRIDSEGTVITKRHEDPFDEFEDFEDEDYV
jgi:ribosomal protein S8